MLNRLVSLCTEWVGTASVGTETRTRAGGQDSEADDGGEPDGDGGAAGPDTDEASLATNGPASAASNVTADGEAGAPTGWQKLLDGETVSKQEVQVELGLQPHEFLAWLVRSSGGRMWQADMVETTGWSKSTVSRYLDTLETKDIVERVQIGRRKLVGVPGEMPTGAQAPETPSGGSSPEPGFWTDEVA